ncbi:MAG: hypothetical protein GY749_09820 [Desulfobacteraceae bacterium]|nr:hypothetical protein [Desulfobacteraceae bacterium]
MFFVLDNSLAENLDDENVITALEYIALGRREGKHLIFSDMKTMKAFATCTSLTPKACRTYQKILTRLPSKKNSLNTLIRQVRIVSEDIGIMWRKIGTGKEIRVSARLIDDSCFIQPAILLCEHENDCELYRKIAEASMKWSNKGKVTVRYEKRGGGGSTTADPIYKNIQKECKRFCLCLCDSDWKYPGGPLGDTAKVLKRTDKPDEGLCECKVIEVREIENLIPTAMFSKVSNPDRIKCIEFLEQLEKSPIAEARKFIDLKNGLKGKEYYDCYDHNSGYWSNLLNTVRSVQSSDGLINECRDNQTCKSPKNCTCSITRGLGEKISEAVVKMLEEESGLKVSEMVDDALKPYWQEYGELVVAWCCGDMPMVSM